MMRNANSVMLTATEAAKQVGLHPETLRRAYRKGELKGYARNSRVIRFDLKEVKRWKDGR